MSWFTLNGPVETSTRIDLNDIVATKTALNRLGYYQPPYGSEFGDWTDREMFDGIKRFQQDNALKVDGMMKPGGPTERTINRQLDGGVELAANTDNGPRTSADGKTQGTPLGKGAATDNFLRRFWQEKANTAANSQELYIAREKLRQLDEKIRRKQQ
ncbi:MAG: peptidoglycan-binding protein [Magnetospirillum sp.]|nr:peptidoglycan-binding protein [Magnetospirillum sp.]